MIFQPKGLHPDSSKDVKAKNLDQTIESKEESEKEGVPGKEVDLTYNKITCFIVDKYEACFT